MPPDGPALRTYQELAGTGARPGPQRHRTPDPARLRLYRAWYQLAETAIYVQQFRQPHPGDLNDAEAWANFLDYLPRDTNWAELKADPP
jgi:hypothetical protein